MANREKAKAGNLNPIFQSARDIAKTYLELVDLKKNNSKAEKITDELFSCSSCFSKAYKFDFSFDLNSGLNRWRFTYNDKGEKDFSSKILNIFRLLDCYGLEKIGKILKTLNMPVTFGIDWKKKDAEPKLKIEFELGKKDINSFKEIFSILGFDTKKVYKTLEKLHDIIAISFAFKGKSVIGWKVYAKCEPAEFHAMPYAKEISKEAESFFKDASDSFCLIGYRFGKDSSLHSVKFYKVYEHRAEVDKEKIYGMYKEIRDILNGQNSKNLNDYISLFNKICSKHGTLVYPVIIGREYKYKEKDFSRITLYLSICSINS